MPNARGLVLVGYGMAELLSGVIRGGLARIEMMGRVPAEGDRTVARLSTQAGPVEIAAPFLATSQDEGQSVYRLEVPLEERHMPIAAIEIVLRSAAGEEEVAAPGAGYELLRLFPKTERDFAANFTWESQRIQDAETLRFAAVQVVRYSAFGASHVAAAAAIIAYRSLDTMDPDQCREALTFVDASIERMPELGTTRHVRTDRGHMTVSLHTIRWHLCLALDQFDEVMVSLDAGYQALMPIEDAWSVGYNGSKLLLLYGFLLWQQGNLEKATEVFDFAFHLFKRVAASSTNDNATLFNDHRVSHRIAFLGMVGKLQMSKKPTPGATVVDLKTVSDEVFRVRNRRALARMREKLEAMVLQLSTRQPSDIASASQSSVKITR